MSKQTIVLSTLQTSVLFSPGQSTAAVIAAGMEQDSRHRALGMDDFQHDCLTAQNWQAEQARWLNESDDHEPISKPAHGLDPETIRALILLVLPPARRASITPRNLQTAFRRFCVLACFVDDDLGGHGFQALAQAMSQAGIATTRACLSAMHCEIADVIGAHRLGRSQAARETYSKRAAAVWAMRERKPKAAQEGVDKKAKCTPHN